MNLIEFLQNLVIKGWKFWSEDNQLRYRAPKEESVALVLEQLKQHKTEILELLRDRPDILNVHSLSYGQRALWFLWQLAPESHAYNVSFATYICSVVDIKAMEKAFGSIMERHPILRTNYPKRESGPIQQLNHFQELNFLQIDASTWSEDKLKAEVFETHKLPLDIEEGAVMRVRWFTRSGSDHILLLTIHHIACDVWSVQLLVQELLEIYQAQCNGVEPSLVPIKHSYQDYVSWQRKILRTTQGEKLWSYWEHQLAGDLPVLNLATDRQRPPIQTYNGVSHHFQLSDNLTKQLKALAQKQGVTFYMILLAAFEVLLYRYTGQEDILVGSPTSGRSQPEFAPIVGYFVDPVVMRADLSNNPSFKNFLPQVRQTVVQALTHQDYPFALLVEKLQLHRDPSRSPIFQASFALQQLQKSEDIQESFANQTETYVDWGGLKLKLFEIANQEGLFDLDLEMLERNSSVKGSFKYNADLFDSLTIERMSAHFQHLLSAIVEDPSQKVNELPLLSEAERDRLLKGWNNTAIGVSNINTTTSQETLHSLFHKQVAVRAQCPAVISPQQTLTYGELDQLAHNLGHQLRQLGATPNTLVAVIMEKGWEQIVAVLGILNSGAAYLPISPEFPPERQWYLLEQGQVNLVLTQPQLEQNLSLPSDVENLSITKEELKTAHSNPLESLQTPDDLAYVIYTSGSTGKPKGVMIDHKGAVNTILDINKRFNVGVDDRVLALSALEFDLSVYDIFGILAAGGTIVIPEAEAGKRKDPAHWLELINSHKVTLWNTVPALMQMLVEHLSARTDKQVGDLRLALLSGDWLPVNLPKQIQSFYSNIQVVSLGGATEASIWSILYPIDKVEADWKSIPYGKPLDNQQFYVLNHLMEPASTWVEGELYIGGIGLAKGYWRDSQKTSNSFITHPVTQERLYKTGDLGWYLPSGDIEFLGRKDFQVKINGYRIELGEVEALLKQHSALKEAVVNSHNNQLVAYIVPKQEKIDPVQTKYLSSSQIEESDDSISTEISEYLKQKLPSYMVPSAFIILDTLPLTANGKVNRKGLPVADEVIIRENEYVAPRTPNEEIIANIFAEVLGVQNVGIHDNFFKIGGDSILSIQVVSRAKSFGIKITPKQIFQYQTIAELAIRANKVVSAECKQGVVTGVAPLTPIQRWFKTQHIKEEHHYNQSVLLQISSDIKPELLEKAVEKLLSHHDALRLRFTNCAEHQQTNHGLDDTLTFTVVDLSSTPREQQSAALEQIATEYQSSLNLSTGPIMQVVMFNLGSKSDARLLIIIHHLAVDGVSWRILLSDLSTIYQQLIGQKTIQLNAKTTAFIDWATKLNSYAQSELIEQELEYWIDQPWSLKAPLPLDNNDNKQSNTVGSAIIYSVKLSQSETHMLLGSVNEAYNTQINDILLSALAISLAQWSGNSKVLIDLEGHGREELFESVDLSRTVGWFTSLFPVLLQLPNDDQLSSTIKSIKEQLREIPNHGVGFGILYYLCSDATVNEKLKTIPTPEISFNYLGQFDQVQSKAGWKFASESTGSNRSLDQVREHLLDINCLVVEGKLKIDWTYSNNIHSHSTVENLAQSYVKAIRLIIDHCHLEESTGYTPSDFPDIQLNQSKLDKLLELLDA